MATVEQQIAVKIKAFVEGLGQVQALSASVKDLANIKTSGLGSTVTGIKAVSAEAKVANLDLKNLFATLATPFKNQSVDSFLARLNLATAKITEANRLLTSGQQPKGLLGPGNAIQLPPSTTQGPSASPIALPGTIANPDDELAVLRARNASKAIDEEGLAAGKTARNVATLQQALAGMDEKTRAATLSQLKGVKGFEELSAGVGKAGGQVTATTSKFAGFSAALQNIEGTVSSGLSAGLERVGAFIVNLGKRLISTTVIVLAFTAAFEAFSLIKSAFDELIVGGVQFDSTLEQARISLAALITQTSTIKDSQGNLVTGADAFTAALSIANDEMGKVQTASFETGFLFQDILKSIELATAAVGGTNVSIKETIGLVADLAIAAKSLNLTPSQFQTQTRQILLGATRQQTILATALFPGQSATDINKSVKGFRDAGTLTLELTKRLQAFHLAQNEVVNTFETLSTNAKDAIKIFSGLADSKLFDSLKAALKFITAQIVTVDETGVHLTPTFQKIADILDTIGGEIGTQLLVLIGRASEGINNLVGGISASKDELKLSVDGWFAIAEQLAGIVGDLFKMITPLRIFEDSVNSTGSGLGAIAKLIEFIRGGIDLMLAPLNLMVDLMKVIASVIGGSIATAISFVTDGLDAAARTTERWEAAVRALLSTGIVEFFNTITAANATSNPLIQPNSNTPGLIAQTPHNGNFTATPRPAGPSTAEATKRGAREQISALKQLAEATIELSLATAKKQVDIENSVNDEIIKAYERRYGQGLESAKAFYLKKEELTLQNLKREEDILKQQQESEAQKLRLTLAALEGKANISDSHFSDLLGQFKDPNATTNPKDATLNKQKVEFLRFEKQDVEIQKQLSDIEQKRNTIRTETNNSLQDTTRETRQLAESIKGELSDALGQAGISAETALSKRISDEFGKVQTAADKLVPGVNEATQAIFDLGNANIDDITKAFEAFGVDITDLSPQFQNFIKLVGQLHTANSLNTSSGEANRLKDKLGFDLQGVQTGFEHGDVSFTDAVTTAQNFTKQAIANLNIELAKQKASLDQLHPANLEEAAALDTLTQKVANLGREIEKLGNGQDTLSLVSAAEAKGENDLSAKLEQIAIQQRAGAINAVQASDQETAARQVLIDKLQEELQALLLLDQAVPENAAKVVEITNKIGDLRNQQNAQFLDLRDNILNSIGGAFNNFFDSIASGNEGMLASFKKAVAGMLAEIAKLIFQTFVLKQIMASIQSIFGGLGGIFGGSTGGASAGGGVPDSFPGLAEGGIISGPGTGVSDSIPALLSHGEAVIPARRVSAYGRDMIQSIISGSFMGLGGFKRFASGGFADNRAAGQSNSGRGGTRIVNIIDKSEFHNFMSSSDGEQIIVNVIGRNRNLIQQLAG